MKIMKITAGPALFLALLLSGCPAAPAADTPAAAATVTLAWSGEADLDLELWSDTGIYLGDANDWCSRPDVTRAEEFAFRAYNAEEDLRGGKGAHFEQGAYVVAVTVWSADKPCTAVLTLQKAGGEAQTLTRELVAQESLVWYAWRWDNGQNTATIIDTAVYSPLLAAH